MDRTIRPLGWIRSANSPSCSPGPSTSRIRDNSTTNKENRDKTPTSRATPTHAPRLALQTVDANSDILRPSQRATPKRPISTSTPKSQGVQSKLSSFFVQPQPQPQPQPRPRPRPSQHATPTPKRARIQPNTPVVSFDDDQQVHQRAQQLLRSGRFGSVPRSVPSSTPNTSTPTLRSSPPPQASDVEEEMSPAPAPARVIKPNPPTRPARPPPVPAPPSSDPEDEPEPEESLASLGPFSWQIRAAPLMAEYKRRAGLSESQIFTHQRERMQAQVASAHERLLGTNTRSHITPRRQPPAPAPAPAQTTPSRTFKPLSQQTPPLEPPKPVSRSPKSKRRIYALETQARPSHPRSSQESPVLQLAPLPRPRPPPDSDETQPLAWDRDGDEEEEDETQPLAWDDESESESEAEAEDDELVVAETQGAEREPSGKDRDGQVASHEPSSSTHHPNPVTLSSPSGTGRFDAVLSALRHTTQAATCTSPTATDKQANLHRFGFASGYGHCRASGPGSAVPLGADLQDELSDDDDDDETQPLSLPLPEPDSETLPLSQELRIPPSSASSADWVPGESMRSADDAAVRFIRDL